MKRARLVVDDDGYVTLFYDDPVDGYIERTFYCPRSGGFVREHVARLGPGNDPQVCAMLMQRGPTLIAPSRADMPAVIRREWAKFRNMLKKEARKW